MAAKLFGKVEGSGKEAQDPAETARDAVEALKERVEKVKYIKPKVLAIDLPDEDYAVIEEGGFNVRKGTFGSRYAIEPADRFIHVPFAAELPNASEQEIVVVDLSHRSPIELPVLPDAPIGKPSVWQRLGTGILDPRPRAMKGFQPDFDRIYQGGGGIFIVFADYQTTPDYCLAETRGGRISQIRDLHFSDWGVLGILEQFLVGGSSGSEIHLSGGQLPATKRALGSAGTHYRCLVHPPSGLEDRWTELARTKFGETIAGVLKPPKDEPSHGWIFIFPQVESKGQLVRDLLEDFLPGVSPKLFPQDDRQAWVNSDQYALPGVLELQGQIREAEKTVEATIAEYRKQIKQRQTERGYLHRILTAQSDELVEAVKATLDLLGFGEITDVDQEEEAENGRLREDLRIKNDLDTVLIEVKGITNLPRDAEALQVGKYIPVRMKQWETTKVRGLSIINHQKGLTPLERDNEGVFHDDIETNAQTLDFGLLTTWDLYRLARNYERLGWAHEDIRDLLLKSKGRIEPVPAHYEFVGVIENYFAEPEVIAVQLGEGKKIAIGDRLAYELPLDFIEEDIASMEIDKAAIAEAESKLVALKTALAKEQAKNKTRVFRVDRPAAGHSA